ncbi:MAG: hypothetical protein WDZ91_00360 [Paenibacillaceae bacterium]
MESIRRIFMIGTIAFAITVSSGIWSNTASANLLISIDELEAQKMLHTDQGDIEEDLHLMLGYDSEEEFNEAITNHQSLAEVAETQHVDVQKIIALQSSQLMEQMDERLAKGYLTLHEYGALTAEIPEIIRKSVYGESS